MAKETKMLKNEEAKGSSIPSTIANPCVQGINVTLESNRRIFVRPCLALTICHRT